MVMGNLKITSYQLLITNYQSVLNMNILYLTNHLNIGGITSYCLTLGGGLKAKGHNVFIASSGGEMLLKFIEQDMVYLAVPMKTKNEISPRIFISFLKLSGLIKKYKIDIIHSNSRTTQVLACLLSRKTKVAHVYTCHGFFKQRITRRLFPCWGKMVIAISQQVKEHLVNDFKVSADKIEVIHNGIDVGKFSALSFQPPALSKERLGLKNAPVIGIIARLSDIKGHIYLIKSFKEVLKEMPAAQLLIVGEGRMKGDLMGLVEILGIGQNVVFKSGCLDTAEVLRAMDIFVLPSLKEGLGLALMEAMAAGLSAIGSNIGGIKSLIKDGNTGLLVEPADEKGLTNAMLRLLKDPQLCAGLGKNASSFISENFSQDKMVKLTEELYLRCA